nr:RNA-directed DNA polymerase, eukaryota [Tanacetum cinerariifolium]
MDIEENVISSFARKRLCIKTKQANNILEKFKVIFKGNVYMAHAKELFAWTLIFLDYKESGYISNNESLHGAKNKSVGSQHGEDDMGDDSDVEGFTSEVSRQENDHRGLDLNTKTDKVNSPLVYTKVMNNSHEIKDKKLQQSSAINSIKENLIDIDKNLDSGNVSDEILLERMELTRQLHDINQMDARDYVQKSKIKWAIEGDENSKFFHGIINKKRSQLSIRGVFVDGDWNTDPEVVKDVFKDHFCNLFQTICPCVSRDEIRVAVWNCDENKSPGTSGGSFSKGSNLSFIALILKVTDAKFVTDFRPTSLIRCVYKVVTKILANSLATVISDLVSDIQLAFVANIQILDVPFILNELLAWCKRKKKQTMIFKVDFAKAYDSVH